MVSGMVLTVSGPMRESMYRMSGYAGFLVEVEAQSGRWTRAPRADSAYHRGTPKVATKRS